MNSNRKKEHNVKIGDVAFICDENVKRINWPIGRVIELMTGKNEYELFEFILKTEYLQGQSKDFIRWNLNNLMIGSSQPVDEIVQEVQSEVNLDSQPNSSVDNELQPVIHEIPAVRVDEKRITRCDQCV